MLSCLATMQYVPPVVTYTTSSSGQCSTVTSDNSYTEDEEWDVCVHPKDHQVRLNRKNRTKRPTRAYPYPLRTPSFSSTSSQYSSTSDGFRNNASTHPRHRRRGQSMLPHRQRGAVDVSTIVLNGHHPGYKPCRLPCVRSETLQESHSLSSSQQQQQQKRKLPLVQQRSSPCYIHPRPYPTSSASPPLLTGSSRRIVTTSRKSSSVDVTLSPPGSIRWSSETKTKLLPGIT